MTKYKKPVFLLAAGIFLVAVLVFISLFHKTIKAEETTNPPTDTPTPPPVTPTPPADTNPLPPIEQTPPENKPDTKPSLTPLVNQALGLINEGISHTPKVSTLALLNNSSNSSDDTLTQLNALKDKIAQDTIPEEIQADLKAIHDLVDPAKVMERLYPHQTARPQ